MACFCILLRFRPRIVSIDNSTVGGQGPRRTALFYGSNLFVSLVTPPRPRHRRPSRIKREGAFARMHTTPLCSGKHIARCTYLDCWSCPPGTHSSFNSPPPPSVPCSDVLFPCGCLLFVFVCSDFFLAFPVFFFRQTTSRICITRRTGCPRPGNRADVARFRDACFFLSIP